MILNKEFKQDAPFLIHDITRKVNNVLTQGTTLFTLAPNENDYLMLVVKGSWSGGAFLPRDEKHKAISNAAIQHFNLSFAEDEHLVMERTHEFSVWLSKNGINIGDNALQIVTNRKSFANYF